MDFNFYINQMILEGETKSTPKDLEKSPFHMFKKKPYLSIKDL